MNPIISVLVVGTIVICAAVFAAMSLSSLFIPHESRLIGVPLRDEKPDKRS